MLHCISRRLLASRPGRDGGGKAAPRSGTGDQRDGEGVALPAPQWRVNRRPRLPACRRPTLLAAPHPVPDARRTLVGPLLITAVAVVVVVARGRDSCPAAGEPREE